MPTPATAVAPAATRPPLPTPAAEAHTLTPDPADVFGDHEAGVLDRLVLALQQWHDDTHAGAWRFCAEQPCDVTRRITGQSHRP